jgi:hypothetical protein
MEEQWKLVKVTKLRKYEVSSIGRRRVTSIKTNEVLKLDFGTTNHAGYKIFNCLGRAHRIIAQAFIINRDNKPYINHIDVEACRKRSNQTIYSFIHKSGLTETCTMYELRLKYNLCCGNLSAVCKGKAKQHKSWSLNACCI